MGQSLGDTNSDSSTNQKLLAGGVKGLAGGLSDYERQNAMLRQGGPAMPVPMPQQPQVQLPMGNQPFNQPQKRGPNNLSFYGGQ